MKETLDFSFCDEDLVASSGGALYWPTRSMLIVADLHFEKGSAFGAQGAFLPPYDSRSTLQRLAALIRRFKPRTVICLGDSFHDRAAGDRMAVADFEVLAGLSRSREWVWIVGNHDPALPAGLGGTLESVFDSGPLHFRHEAAAGIATGEISGHFHPKARVKSRGRTLSCRCFATDGRRLILPAFGAYTGGLNVLDAALAPILGRNLTVYALRRDAVHAVGRRSLAAEPGARRQC